MAIVNHWEEKMEVKEGDWVVFDMRVGQIKRIHDNEFPEFSDGTMNTSGRIADRCRPLTLRNKRIAENFDYYYNSLREIDGERGFNYPDIHRYFSQLALDAIDADDHEKMFDQAQAFVMAARDHTPTIDGVSLFGHASRKLTG